MTTPLLTFLTKAPFCPPFDMIEKYQEGLLDIYSHNIVSEHFEQCVDCNKIKDLDIQIKINKDKIREINKKLSKSPPKDNNITSTNINLNPGQIWATKNKIYSILGEELYTFYPYLVLIKTKPQLFAERYPIIRIQPISIITEFSSEGDIYISDASYIGEKFIIETWNEQPMLKNNLKEFMTDINEDSLIDNLIKDKGCIFSDELISNFRFLEIENTTYLRRPVRALIEYYEENDDIEYPVLNDKGNITYLKDYWKPEPSQEGNVSERLSLNREKQDIIIKEGKVDNIRFKLFIRKIDKEYYIMLSSENTLLEIYNKEFKILKGRIEKKEGENYRTYERLTSDIYYIWYDKLLFRDRLILSLI